MSKFCSLTAALGLLLVLSGCGSEKAPPEEYELGEEVLPALTQVVPPIDMESVTYTPPEEEGDPYGYGGLPEETAADYAAALTEKLEFSRMDENCVRQEKAADYTVPGQEIFGRESGENVLRVDLDWDGDQCSVTLSLMEGAALKDPPKPKLLTMEEAVAVVKQLGARSLGLEGEVDDYTLIPEEGLVLLDGKQCVQVKAYAKDDGGFEGQYLVQDAAHIYQVDQDRQAEQISA